MFNVQCTMFNVQCTMFNVQCVTMYLLYCCYLWDHKNKPQVATKVSEDAANGSTAAVVEVRK